MGIQLTGEDLIDFAVQTEIHGAHFYREAAELSEDDEASDLFEYLAFQEERHRLVFEGLSEAVVPSAIDADEAQEALGYISAAVDQEFFGRDAALRQIAPGATTEEMLQQAMEFERETLLFFYGLRDLVRSPNKLLLDDIIAEEKSHMRQLARLLGD